MKKIYGTFGVEMRAYGQKLVKFCKHTDTQTHASKLVVEISGTFDRKQIEERLNFGDTSLSTL